ncbi:hypothetical protein MKX03_016804 [Papaver bracteatum]|nr:hypothetical protein MKX03_016804 [Papaver bracteatum]
MLSLLKLAYHYLSKSSKKTPNQVDAERELVGKTIKVCCICNMKSLGYQIQSSIKG